MEFLTTNTKFTHAGYPLIIFYLIGIIGIILALFRPYRAFLFALFCLAARNFHAAVFTRTPFAGPYFNLNDLLLWIAFLSMFFEVVKTKKVIYIPKVLLAIFLIILIGDFQSIFKYGLIEDVKRRIWSTAIFPILFLVSANMVKNEKRAKLFYWALFLGAVLAALQHMYYIGSVLHQWGPNIRTISYIASGGLYLVIAAIFAKREEKMGRNQLITYYGAIALIALSYILSLTRGIYVISIAILLVFPFVIKRKYRISKIVYRTSFVFGLAIFIVRLVFPNLNIENLLKERFESFIYPQTFEQAYATRKLGSQTELELWLSSPIFGMGSSLPPEYEFSEVEATGALYHVAYSTYLAHYGLIGLFLYGFLLPISTILAAKKYYLKYMTDHGGKIALIAITCALFDIFALPWSYHYLGATSHMPGLIYGAIWGLYRFERADEKVDAFNTYKQHSFVPSSSFRNYGK